jgi:hypothetical protein
MHYPYRQGKAGRPRSRYRTAEASEYLLADSQVVSLAKQVLSNEEYLEAEDLAVRLAGTKREKDHARARLVELVKPPPKRPIYYAQEQMLDLPRWTRDALRYLGDYIDILVKSAVYEKTKGRAIFNTSLGPAIEQFQRHWPDQVELANLLRGYNRFLYRGAKHDFKLPPNRKTHRFTSREVVLTAFTTMKLAKRLTTISGIAQLVSRDEEIP